MTTTNNPTTAPNRYRIWNDALAARFFNEEMAGRNVHLYVNQGLVTEIGQVLPGAGDFRSAVARSPQAGAFNGERVCARAIREFRSWRTVRSGCPPYIAYLCLFVLASGTDGDFAPNAYYPRLWTLMGHDGRTGPVRQFDHMRDLWDDLEEWTVFDKQGELGIFRSRSIGGLIHVGYPLSQSLLVEQERKGLPQIFYDAGLEPAGDYPTDELARTLRHPLARKTLRPRTVRLVKSQEYADLYNALLDAVAEELFAWDGTVPTTTLGRNGLQDVPARAGLRICIELDRVSNTVNASIRCKLNREFPDDGLSINGELEAGEFGNGWSLPIRKRSTAEILDACQIDWNNGATMKENVLGLQLKLPGRDVRVFTSGLQEGISGLVETHMVPREQPFYLAYSEAVWPRLERWATRECRGFQEIAIAHGLPEGWRFAGVESATSDEAVRDEFTSLSFTSGTRLKLVGGIRSGAGTNFFHFAPPSVSLLGGTPNTEVYCGDLALSPSDEGRIFALAGDLPSEARISLEAREGGPVDRLNLFLTGDFSVAQIKPGFFLGPAGTSISDGNDQPSIAGAYLSGIGNGSITTTAEMFEDFAFEIGAAQGCLIGRRPGQFATWPREAFPTGWVPAWAVKKQGRKLTAIYTGDLLRTIQPENPSFTPTHREVKDWKKVIWHQRKRITPPQDQRQRALWLQLQESAHNV